MERAVQGAASSVTVDEQRRLTRLGARQGEVRGEKGLAVADPRARHGDDHGTIPTIEMKQAQPHAAHRFDHLSHVLVVRPGRAVLHVRQHAQDRQPHLARHLLRVTHARVEPVAHHGAQEPQAEASGKAKNDEPRRRVLEWLLRGHRRVENPHVGDGARVSKAGLVVPLLHASEEVRSQVDVATQARLIDDSLRNPPQLRVSRGDLRRQHALTLRQIVSQRSRQRRNGGPFEHLDLSAETADGGVIGGIAGVERASFGPFRRQIAQGQTHIR